MNATTTVQVPHPILLDLLIFLRQHGDQQDPGEAVAIAVQYWLDAMKKQAHPNPVADVDNILHGYQWKSVFLPEGTRLRMLYQGDHDYAVVEGDRIMYHDRAVTPNQFVNAFGGGTRNAWHDISLRMPGEKYWRQASRYRNALRTEMQSQTGDQAAVKQLGQLPAPPTAASRSFHQTNAQPPSSPAPQPAPQPAPPPARDRSAESGWNLPERRQFRFRIEDVAF